VFAAQCTQSRRREVGGSEPRELSTLNLPAYKVAKRRRLAASKVAVNDYKSSSKAPYF
jgi:hypothetical protein